MASEFRGVSQAIKNERKHSRAIHGPGMIGSAVAIGLLTENRRLSPRQAYGRCSESGCGFGKEARKDQFELGAKSIGHPYSWDLRGSEFGIPECDLRF